MGTRNTTTTVFPVFVATLALCLALAGPAQARESSAPVAPPRHELALAAETMLALGPFPDVPVYDYPRGVGLLLRYTYRPPHRAYAPGVELVRPGITVAARAPVAGAGALEPVFDGLLLLLPSLEAGVSVAMARVLDRGLAVDATVGGGLYVASYGFTATTLQRVRPMASAHLTLRTLGRHAGLSAAVGWIAFAERELRHFVSVRMAVEVFAPSAPDPTSVSEAIR